MTAKHYTLQAVCPNTNRHKTVKVMDDDLRRVLDEPPHKFYELSGDKMTYQDSCVQDVLLNPDVIFGGVREFQQGGCCYVGQPSRRWFNSGSQGPPPPGMVFVVFVSPRDCVYEWRWEKADPNNERMPTNCTGRFKDGLIWSK